MSTALATPSTVTAADTEHKSYHWGPTPASFSNHLMTPKICLQRMNLQDVVKESCVSLLPPDMFVFLPLKMHTIFSFAAKYC